MLMLMLNKALVSVGGASDPNKSMPFEDVSYKIGDVMDAVNKRDCGEGDGDTRNGFAGTRKTKHAITIIRCMLSVLST